MNSDLSTTFSTGLQFEAAEEAAAPPAPPAVTPGPAAEEAAAAEKVAAPPLQAAYAIPGPSSSSSPRIANEETSQPGKSGIWKFNFFFTERDLFS